MSLADTRGNGAAVQPGGARGNRDRVTAPRQLGAAALELLDLWADRERVAHEDVGDGVDFSLRNIGTRQRDAGHKNQLRFAPVNRVM